MSLDQAYWEIRWQRGETGWDMRQASPPLMEYALQISPEKRTRTQVLLPGCGNGHEALALAEAGFAGLTMLDIAPTAVAAIQQRLDARRPAYPARVLCTDFFEHTDRYDLILEQTFFCALNPDLRAAYAQKMFDLLNPGGKLAGVWFDRAFPGGPPFGGNTEEYKTLFAPFFRLHTVAPCYNSIPARAGSEVFMILERL
jgi:methyl halide transferase